MTWYQTISLVVALFFSWQLLVPLYNIIHGQKFTIGLIYRIFFTLVFVNLALAFGGTPW